MVIHQVFALIQSNYVQNLIVCETYYLANELAVATLGSDAFAVEATQYPIEAGYTYVDGKFYDLSNNVVEPIPTVDEQVNVLTQKYENYTVNKAVSELELDYRLTLLESLQ